MKRKEFRFFISQRVPRFSSPARRTETLASQRNDRYLPAFDDGQLVLAYLIAFWQIRIKIILACEDRAAIDTGADRESEPYGTLDRASIQDRQHAWQCNINGAGL